MDGGPRKVKSPRLMQLEKVFPILRTTRGYNRETLSADLLAALIVTIMLIPQSLAYSLLAGLPAEVGLYASILPLIVYALFGTSRTLAVGPSRGSIPYDRIGTCQFCAARNRRVFGWSDNTGASFWSIPPTTGIASLGRTGKSSVASRRVWFYYRLRHAHRL